MAHGPKLRSISILSYGLFILFMRTQEYEVWTKYVTNLQIKFIYCDVCISFSGCR